MKPGFTTSHQSQIRCLLSGQQQVKAIQSDQRRRQGFGLRILGCARFLFIDYLEKGRTISNEYYITLLVHLKEEIAPKRPQMKKKKVLFHEHNAPYHKSIATMAKLHELHFELLMHPPCSLDLAPSDNWTFADLKKNLQGKRFGSNEEMISETEAYFVAKDKSFDKKGIELLEKR